MRRILKTVDSVEQDVKSLEACRDKCLGSLEPCRSYDFNDTGNSVCRLSHHTALTLAHIKEPYLSMSTAVTYEMTACYNIEVQCRGTDMLAKIKSTKLFNGKIYAKESPMGCMSSIQDSMEFELSMPYESKACKALLYSTMGISARQVTKSLPGEYTNQIVVQHHKNIVTSADLGLSLICMYDLGSRNVTNNVSLEVEGKIEQIVTEEAYVESPDIIMRITDRKGNDISFAQVGDSLKLVFEISDNRYDLMVTKLYALDGIDALEIPLIDDEGCPTETFIMGPIERYEKNTDDDGEEKKQDASKKRFQILETKFEAFKFPVSDIVSFRALVTPCVHSCPPVTCDVLDFNGGTARIQSYGRRKRSPVQDFLRKKRSTKDDDLFVIQSITISDKYGRSRSNRRLGGDAVATGDSLNTTVTEVTIQGSTDAGVCINMVGIIVACSLFLVAQLVVIVAWTYIWQKRRQNKLEDGPIPETTADSLTQLFNSGYPARRF
ncbi:unnamed protein product [Darwinula stevensoni]|uniref:ZP domain-containing protein n=1 Tax=Darwinula stevensoni TaxID=69355 RepID=A0A7R9A338_9CRUS|nr:unnamed protein product [Darwinula stevensoni]CAG0881310.1 unnamed protein product [Darwinula stevensoni]